MKKIQLFLLILLLALPMGGHAQQTLYGDVNGDGQVNITDVTVLIDYLLSGDESPVVMENADVHTDGSITITDVSALIDKLLTGTQDPSEEGDWVDLGLPSGTIWATRNVGASAPEDYGDYFAWGETSPKDYYDWTTYKWYQEYYDADGHYHDGYTKYCTNSDYGLDGFVDNKTELDASDDAACTHYPGGRMPSQDQIQELCDNCSWQWTQRNGVNGQLVTGPNGNTMFLPAAGYRWDESLGRAGSYGYYWSRTLNSSFPNIAYCLLYFYSGYVYWGNHNRRYGHAVRAVRVS